MAGRRRGEALEEAILDAAWAELEERGYPGLRLESVAARAGTSRPVLARRWDSRAALAIAALRRRLAMHPLQVADLGELRAELLAFLDRLSERGGIMVAFTLLAAEHFSTGAAAPAQLRAQLVRGETPRLPEILARAVARGEADPERLTPRVMSLLQDLSRHYAVMNFQAPPRELREAWVDELFLPLVRPASWSP